jgi:exonuclease SbcD
MSEKIRMLHFADLHVGMENYGRIDPASGTSSRVRDFLNRLDEVINHALEHEADIVIFAGDAFKNRDPEPTQQREFAKRIKRLADEVPTLLVVGNHDMPGMAAKASSMDIFRALDVPGVIVGYKPDSRVVQTKRGPIYLAWMPYPMRNRLLVSEEHYGKSIEELEVALRTTVADILEQLAKDADEQQMPRVLAGHFTVSEAEYGSERSVMLGRDVAVFLSTLADPRWDYVALGHIHRYQSINKDKYPAVVYSGSLERIDFGEEDERKGFCWVELARQETTFSFIPVAARPFLTIQVDVRQEEEPTEAVLKAIEGKEIEGAVVRVMIQMHSTQEVALREREVDKALSSAASVSIARQIEIETRARLGDMAPESLTPVQLVEQYFKATNVSEDRVKKLLDMAEELLK